MTITTKDRIICYFPYLHTELINENIPKEAKIIDPGISRTGKRGRNDGPGNIGGIDQKDQNSRLWKPDNLPFDSKTLSSMLNQYHQFGEQCKKPSDLSYFAVAGLDDSYAGSTQEIRSELKSMDKPASEQPSPEENLLKTAQVILGLAFQLEQNQLDVMAEDKTQSQTWDKFDKNLGLEKGISIYEQYKKENSRFDLVPNPILKKEVWDNFVP